MGGFHLIFVVLVALFNKLDLGSAQMVFTTTSAPSEDDYLTNAYCYRFTWLGPKYNVESEFYNATCDDVVTDKNVPCTHPLVVTNNSNVPDTEYLWEKFKRKPKQIACRLVRGEVCAKYSFIFNGAVENVTYLCSKIKMVNDTREIDNDCFRQRNGAREIEVCACRSRIGEMPCNSSISSYSAFNIVAMMMTIIMMMMIIS